MARFEGTQNIPSEYLDKYRGTLNPHPTGGIVKKRYPYRLPNMQAGKPGETQKQRTQRQYFRDSISKFKALSTAEKQRWYDTMPPWSSYLWYYNWFMLNGVPNLWGVVPGGAAILKSLQHLAATIATGGSTVSIPTAVDVTIPLRD